MPYEWKHSVLSIYRAPYTFNVLTLRLFTEQTHFQIPPKLFGVNSWIAQTIGQWIPNCRSGVRKCTGWVPQVLRLIAQMTEQTTRHCMSRLCNASTCISYNASRRISVSDAGWTVGEHVVGIVRLSILYEDDVLHQLQSAIERFMSPGR